MKKDLNISFLCGYFPDEVISEVREASTGVIQYAAHALQSSFIKGLMANFNSLQIINCMYIGSYPKRYKKCIIRNFDITINKVQCGFNVGFFNFMIIKNFSRLLSLINFFLSKKFIKPDVLFVYAMHSPFLMAASFFKWLCKDVRIILIVPDLPLFMNESNGLISKAIFHIQNLVYKVCSRSIDGYVLLTPAMATKLNLPSGKWVVVEGIAESNTDVAIPISTAAVCINRYIFYSGTLDYRYGIMNLLEAFAILRHSDVSLLICGEGACKDEIIKRSQANNNIKYLGQISREDALQYQCGAIALVNPRASAGEFTKYSFPSKIMEYFSSGVPVVMHALEGIPDEYFKYAIVCKDDSIVSLAEAVDSVLDLGEPERMRLGALARNFVLMQKSPSSQIRKICAFFSL